MKTIIELSSLCGKEISVECTANPGMRGFEKFSFFINKELAFVLEKQEATLLSKLVGQFLKHC